MDIQRKCFEESNNVNPDWSFKFDEELQQYIALDSEMELQVDEFNEHWDAFRAGWQAAKAHEAEKLKAVHDSRIQFVEYVNKIENGDYVLVSKQCPDPDFADALFDLLSKKAIGEFGEDQMIYFSDIDEEKIWGLMLEAAQEPAND